MKKWTSKEISTMLADRMKNDRWFNDYHVSMPTGLMNDPNGLAYMDGFFYIFFQWNPYGCEHKNKCWGLTKTKDFVHFTVPQVVLRPEDWFDKDGCYSGNAVTAGDVLHLFYTGNVKGKEGQRISYQCMADIGQDGIVVKQGPVIGTQETGYTAHFRDPMVFEDHDIMYMILGIQTVEQKGRAVVYQSADLKQWEFCGELGTSYNDFGYMWECPNLLKFNKETYALIFSVQGLSQQGDRCHNMYQSGYIIGTMNWESLILEHHSLFEEIDKGFDFYAPQVFKHKDKYIMMGWAGNGYENETEYPSIDHGWVFCLTLPRVLTFKNGKLYQTPLDDLKALRKRLVVYEEAVIGKRIALPGRKAEWELKIEPGECAEVKICFSDEYIAIRFNGQDGICEIDREHMKLGARGVRRFALDVNGVWKIHSYMDSSVMELFFQDGQEAASVMFFPQSEEIALQIIGKRIESFAVWELRNIMYN